jgi:hypothetical protein
MTIAPLLRGFEIQNLDSAAVRVSGKGAGLGIGGLILAAVVSLFVSVPLGGAFSVFVLGQDGLVQLIIVLLTSAGIVAGLNRLKKPPYCFDLNAEGITKNGVLYPRGEISEVFLDNRSIKGNALATGAINIAAFAGMNGSSLDRRVVAANAASAGLIAGSAALGARVNWRVNMRHGMRIVRLATSLDENSAHDLFHFLTQENET